jgi:hypothetical protein
MTSVRSCCWSVWQASRRRSAMFFDPACDWAPQRDFELCTQVDASDFVLRLERGETPARLGRIEVP